MSAQENQGQEAVILLPPGPFTSDRSSDVSAEGGAGAGTSVGRIAYLNVQSKYASASPESDSIQLPGISIILHIAGDDRWLPVTWMTAVEGTGIFPGNHCDPRIA